MQNITKYFISDIAVWDVKLSGSCKLQTVACASLDLWRQSPGSLRAGVSRNISSRKTGGRRFKQLQQQLLSSHGHDSSKNNNNNNNSSRINICNIVNSENSLENGSDARLDVKGVLRIK